MKKIYAAVVFIFFFNLLVAQNPLVKQWDYRFGGDSVEWLTSFKQTTDGGYILGGYSMSGISGDKTQPSWGDEDYWVVKVDSNGNMQWDRRFGGTDLDRLYSALQTSDGGYILGGHSFSGISGDKTQSSWDTSLNYRGDYWIVKTGSTGNKQWDKRFGGTKGEFLSCMMQTDDKGYILGGISSSGSSGDKTQPNWDTVCNTICTYDFWIVKTDSLGNKQWDKRFGGTNYDALNSLQQTADGGYILGGWSGSGVSGDKSQASWGLSDFWIVKTDSLGNKQWDKRFGGTSDDEIYSLEQTSDGGYILGGHSFSGIGGDKTQPTWGGMWDEDYWIVKIDSVGQKQWDKDFGGIDVEDEFGNIFQTTDGGYLFSCTSYSNISGDKTENNLGIEQSWIVKTDSLGNKIWDKTIFTSGHDEIGYVDQIDDGCYTVANYTKAGIGGYKSQPAWNNSDDYWIVKFCDTTATTSITQLTNTQLPFSIYPNPATDYITIQYNLTSLKETTVSVFNVYGQRVNDEVAAGGKQEIKIDMQSFPAGIYFVKVIADGKEEVSPPATNKSVQWWAGKVVKY